MQGSQGRRFPLLLKGLWVACLIAPLMLHYPNIGFRLCVDAEAAEQFEGLLQMKQVLAGDSSAHIRVSQTLGSFARSGDSTISGEGRRGPDHFSTDSFIDNEDSSNDKFTHDEAPPTTANPSTRVAHTLSFPVHGDHSELPLKRKLKCCTPSLLKPQRFLTEELNPLCTSGSVVRNDSREPEHFRGVEHGEEHQQQHPQKQQLGRSHQQQLRHQHEQNPIPELPHLERLSLMSRGERILLEANLRSDKTAREKYEIDTKNAEESKSGAIEEHTVRRSGRARPRVTEEELKVQAVSKLTESLLKERSAEVILQNGWKLIEDSWKRAELLYNNPTAFSASGFQVYQQKDARRVIQAELPFWTVDLLGALHDMAKVAAWRASPVPAPPAATPLRLRTGNAGSDTLLEIGYSPSGQRNTYTFGWNGTQIAYSTGIEPTEAWPIERIGGSTTGTPSSHMMEVTRGDGGGKAFYDLSSRFYGHEINFGDVEMGVRHQFYNDTYNAAPSNVVVRAQNYTVDIAADPTDTSYRIGVGEHGTKVAVLRNFDEKRTAFKGDIMDWVVSWDSDAQDESSSTTSAGAVVGSKNEEPLLTAHLRRGAEGEHAEGDTQIQMRDIGMRMKWKEEGLTGDIKLGKIKYKFDMKEGLPDFTLTAS